MRYALFVTIIIMLFWGLVGNAPGEVPGSINYQARLTDSLGLPLTDGNYDITFSIYNASVDGAQLWTSGTQSVLIIGGLFNYQLGSNAAFTNDLFSADTLRWLGITLGANPELEPRTRITSVAYAYHASHADTADYAYAGPEVDNGWTDDGFDVYLSNSNDSVGIGTSSPQAKLHIQTAATSAKLGHSSYAVFGEHPMSLSNGYLGGNNIGVYGYSDDLYGVKGDTYNGYGVWGGTSDNFGIGVQGENINGNYGYLGGKNYALYTNASSGFAAYLQGKVYIHDSLGIGTVTGKNRLDVKGRAVIGSSYAGSQTAPEDGLLVEGGVGIGLSNPNCKLYIAETYEGLVFPLKLDNYDWHWNDGVGILFSVGGDGGGQLATSRGKGALAYEYTNTWNRGSFHFLQKNSTDEFNPTLDDAVMSITNDGKVGIGTKSPSTLFEMKGSDQYMSLNTTNVLTGLKLKQNGMDKWTMGWNSGNGYLYFYDHNSRDDDKGGTRMIIEDGTGNVGIGTAAPSAKLEVNGDLKVTGNIEGAVTYPSPNYDSGWWDILPGMNIAFTHNIGIDVNKYVVSLEFTSTDHGLGIHNWGIGTRSTNAGVYWHNLTTTTIEVTRKSDDWLCNKVRIRIWMYN
jgi:hypothetical protein